VAGLGGVVGPAVLTAGSMGDWNQTKDGAIDAQTDASGRCADAVDAGVRAMGWHAYYTWVREAAALGERKAGRGFLRNARLDGQNG